MKYNITMVLISMLLFGCTNNQQRLIDKADAYYQKGIKYTMEDKDSLAIMCYDSSLMYYQRPEYYVMRGSVYMSLDNKEKAINDYNSALGMDSTSKAAAYAFKGLSLVYADNDEYIKAIEYAERANQIEVFTISFFDIGAMYYYIGDYKNALINFGQAITTKTASQPIETAHMMGDCYMRLGDIKSAKEYWTTTDSLGYEASSLKLDSLKRINQ